MGMPLATLNALDDEDEYNYDDKVNEDDNAVIIDKCDMSFTIIRKRIESE